MFIVMSARATDAEINAVKGVILAEGLQPHVNPGSERVVIALVGDVGPRRQSLMSRFEAMAGVESVTPISRPYKLASREFHPEDTVIEVGDVRIGDGVADGHGADPARSRAATWPLETAQAVAAAGAHESCAVARSSRVPARTRSRASASRRSDTWPRRAS